MQIETYENGHHFGRQRGRFLYLPAEAVALLGAVVRSGSTEGPALWNGYTVSFRNRGVEIGNAELTMRANLDRPERRRALLDQIDAALVAG